MSLEERLLEQQRNGAHRWNAKDVLETPLAISLVRDRTDEDMKGEGYAVCADVNGRRVAWRTLHRFSIFWKNRTMHRKKITDVVFLTEDDLD